MPGSGLDLGPREPARRHDDRIDAALSARVRAPMTGGSGGNRKRLTTRNGPSEGYSTPRGNFAADSLKVQLPAFADVTTSLGEKGSWGRMKMNSSFRRVRLVRRRSRWWCR